MKLCNCKGNTMMSDTIFSAKQFVSDMQLIMSKEELLELADKINAMRDTSYITHCIKCLILERHETGTL